MKNNNYEVDILVNDKPIKKYSHNGKVFIEAIYNVNYIIRVKNNNIPRVLAISSVDGINTISGNAGEDVLNSRGYIVNGYNSLKIDGFRISDDEVSKFKFSSKEKSYAATKSNDEVKNVGIIGIRIFNEKIKPVITEIHNHYHHVDWIIWGPTTTLGNTSTNYNSVLSSNGTSGHGEVFNCNNSIDHLQGNIVSNAFSSQLRGFDMGTEFGSVQSSKVVTVEFERGILEHSIDVYYASRQSLIEMGIVMSSVKQINFPEAFENKYCQTPIGWKK